MKVKLSLGESDDKEKPGLRKRGWLFLSIAKTAASNNGRALPPSSRLGDTHRLIYFYHTTSARRSVARLLPAIYFVLIFSFLPSRLDVRPKTTSSTGDAKIEWKRKNEKRRYKEDLRLLQIKEIHRRIMWKKAQDYDVVLKKLDFNWRIGDINFFLGKITLPRYYRVSRLSYISITFVIGSAFQIFRKKKEYFIFLKDKNIFSLLFFTYKSVV